MKRPILAAFAATALIGALSACATATPYQPLNAADASAGGYHDVKLDANHWKVTFSGNSVTTRETVERYLLYRAAELTTSQGFDWFQETDKHTDKTADVYLDSYYGYGWRPAWRFYGGPRSRFRGGFYGYGGWGPGWGPGYDPFGPTWVEEYDRYDVTAQIMMGRGPKPAEALNAREVMANLGPSILRPGQPQSAPPPPPPPKG